MYLICFLVFICLKFQINFHKCFIASKIFFFHIWSIGTRRIKRKEWKGDADCENDDVSENNISSRSGSVIDSKGDIQLSTNDIFSFFDLTMVTTLKEVITF